MFKGKQWNKSFLGNRRRIQGRLMSVPTFTGSGEWHPWRWRGPRRVRSTAPYGHPFTEDYPYQKNVGFCCILTLISGRGLVGDYLAVIWSRFVILITCNYIVITWTAEFGRRSWGQNRFLNGWPWHGGQATKPKIKPNMSARVSRSRLRLAITAILQLKKKNLKPNLMF